MDDNLNVLTETFRKNGKVANKIFEHTLCHLILSYINLLKDSASSEKSVSRKKIIGQNLQKPRPIRFRTTSGKICTKELLNHKQLRCIHI